MSHNHNSLFLFVSTRPKLKGTEAEIAMELGVQWQNITFNWKNSDVNISD